MSAPESVKPLPPGSVIGIVGGGQLGRMAALAAARLGYKVHVFTPEADSPASQVSAKVTQADYGDQDAVVANLAHPRFFNFSNKSEVLIQDSPGHWKDIQGDFSVPMGNAGLRYQETHSVPALGDFDLDGDLDLAITAVYEGRPTDFYWGNGDGTFSIDRAHAGISATNGWGLAVADIDNNGSPDMATQGELLQNQLASSASAGWFGVRVIGDGKTNRMGLGATVTLLVGGKSVVRHVSGGNGQGCQDGAGLRFGLGTAKQVDSIQVRFIGGGVNTYAGPFASGQSVRLFESGKVELNKF